MTQVRVLTSWERGLELLIRTLTHRVAVPPLPKREGYNPYFLVADPEKKLLLNLIFSPLPVGEGGQRPGEGQTEVSLPHCYCGANLPNLLR